MKRRDFFAIVSVGVIVFAAAAKFWPQNTDVNPSASISDGGPINASDDTRPKPSSPVPRDELYRVRDKLRASVRAAEISQAEADSAYELVQISLRCEIDAQAPRGEHGHIRSTSEELCKDFAADPLSKREIFDAVTFAAERGNAKAQMDYAGYAAGIFEEEKNALDADLIKEFRENSVRFLEQAGRSGTPEAYARLSDIYKNGTLAQRDPVLAYAYAEAYFQAGSSQYRASFLEGAMASLDGSQLAKGKTIASQILNERSQNK